MGGVPIYRRGSPVDYGPRDASPAEHGQALLQEDVLINEWKIKEAFDADGEEGVERVLREAVDDRIAYAKAEWPEGLPYFEGVKRKMDRGIGRRVSLEKGADSSHLYEVDIPDEQVAKMLDWDAPFSKQPKVVREAILDIVAADGHGRSAGGVKAFIAEHGRFASTGHIDAFYEALSEKLRNQNLRAAKDAGPNPSPGWGDFGYDVRGDKDASAVLREAGIPGIKYLDQGSRGAGEGTRNFVVFDDAIPRILKRDGEPVK